MIDGHIEEQKDNEIIKADELISKLHKYCYFSQIQMKVGKTDTFKESDFEFLHNFINRQKGEIDNDRRRITKR